MHPGDIERRLKEFEDRCRQRGLPVTVQRRAILETVLRRDDHPTADQIYEEVRTTIPAMSRTTVYRALETLVDLGVLRVLSHPGAVARYDGKFRRHHHLVCNKCHKVIDLDNAKLDRLPVPDVAAEGFEIDDFSVHFSGVCAECRRKPRSRV
jgi:Fur family peroxide stress response transcriptional regulator